MVKKKDDPFRIEHVYDDLLTDESILEDVRGKIGRNLAALKDANSPDELLSRCYLLPDSFKLNTKAKLNQTESSDVESVKACRLALNEIDQLKKMLMKDGIIDRDAATIYFHSLRLCLNLFRAGTLAETVQREEKRRDAYRTGPGARSREEGELALQRAKGILFKIGGIAGYDALPRGEKTPIINQIAKAINPNREIPSTRNVNNLLKKLRNEEIKN